MAETSRNTFKAVGISGSPSPNSRSKILLAHSLDLLADQGIKTQLIDLANLPADGLLMRRSDALVDEAIQQATQANILIISTPVYRATYTGQLKLFFDLFPQNALRGVVVGLIATGASPYHALSIDHGLRPLVASVGGLSAAQVLYVTDSGFPDKNQIPTEIAQVVATLAAEVQTLAHALAVGRSQQNPVA